MFDPTQITFGQVSSTIRDFTIIGVLVTAVWKARGWFEAGTNFFQRLNRHMDVMESKIDLLLTNHLKHIEADLAKMSGRKPEDTKFE